MDLEYLTLNLLNKKEYSWLKKGDFYKTLDLEGNPDEPLYVKFCSVNENDIQKYIECINFWMIHSPSKKLYELASIFENFKYIKTIQDQKLMYKLLKGINIKNIFAYSIPKDKNNPIDFEYKSYALFSNPEGWITTGEFYTSFPKNKFEIGVIYKKDLKSRMIYKYIWKKIPEFFDYDKENLPEKIMLLDENPLISMKDNLYKFMNNSSNWDEEQYDPWEGSV